MKSPETTKEAPKKSIDHVLELARHMLEDYSEEFPEEIIIDPEEAVTHKCQKNWFQGVVNVLQDVQEHQEYRGQIFHPDITSFLAHYTGQGFHNQMRTTLEDTNRANDVLKLSMGILNKMKK